MILEITIPVLNEEITLRSNVGKLLAFLESSEIKDYRIVVADNGSTDSTEQIGRQMEKSYPEVKYIRLAEKGVGLALRTSWIQSQADIVTYMDLDLATDLKHLIDAYDEIKSSDIDMINGSRLLKQSMVMNRKPIREISSRCFNFFARKLLKLDISDFTCGFKMLRKDVAQAIIQSHAVDQGWFFIIKIIAVAKLLNYKMKEIPIIWVDDPNSSINIPQLSIYYFKETIKLHSYMKERGWSKAKTKEIR